jgi:hypothetical protein
MAFGTASNTYRMAGIASAASLAAQSGPTYFVTSDAAAIWQRRVSALAA